VQLFAKGNLGHLPASCKYLDAVIYRCLAAVIDEVQVGANSFRALPAIKRLAMRMRSGNIVLFLIACSFFLPMFSAQAQHRVVHQLRSTDGPISTT